MAFALKTEKFMSLIKKKITPANDFDTSSYYAGTSGLVLPVPKYRFPEAYREASRLTYYATFFNSIEINSSFYKLPMPKTVMKWADQVPENFKFTFKLWQEISHAKNLNFREEDVQKFFVTIAGSGSKKGCVLIQFPPGINNTYRQQLQALLYCVKQNNVDNNWKIAVEFRHSSWYQTEVYEMLEQHNITLVIHDMPGSVSPLISTNNCMYIRFHGTEGKYGGSYTDHFLAEYATYIKEWLKEGKTVYTYFNNTIGNAFRNQESLNRLIYK